MSPGKQPPEIPLHRGLSESLRDLAAFLGAEKIDLPKGWYKLL